MQARGFGVGQMIQGVAGISVIELAFLNHEQNAKLHPSSRAIFSRSMTTTFSAESGFFCCLVHLPAQAEWSHVRPYFLNMS